MGLNHPVHGPLLSPGIVMNSTPSFHHRRDEQRCEPRNTARSRLRCAAVVWFALSACLSWCHAKDEPTSLRFQHHFIHRDLPVRDGSVGDYGLTALLDIDRDGDLDFVLGGRGVQPSSLYWFEYVAADRWIQHRIGTNYLSDVGLAALDVDRDGWIDLVCSGVWYRNSGKPRETPFERLEFASGIAGAHDIVAARINDNITPDIVLMGDERTRLRSIQWFEPSPDVTRPWKGHRIGDAVHGAFAPAGIGDLDGDGDNDVVRADTWFENAQSDGTVWKEHPVIPFGRKGPYGVCTRTVVLDIDQDRRNDLVVVDADIVGSMVAIFLNGDGRGNRWERIDLPQSFVYGSLHSLAVADLDGDGDPDIVANEQEELLPEGRENPRWVVWENLGKRNFAERIILDQKLGGHELQVGDVDADGDIDICSKVWGPRPWNGAQGRAHVDYLENLTRK